MLYEYAAAVISIVPWVKKVITLSLGKHSKVKGSVQILNFLDYVYTNPFFAYRESRVEFY